MVKKRQEEKKQSLRIDSEIQVVEKNEVYFGEERGRERRESRERIERERRKRMKREGGEREDEKREER